MKACNNIRGLLAAFIEGETSPEETRRITEHLSSCQECKKALAELKKTVELVKNLDEVEPPPFFTQKIMAHVREEAEESRVMGHGSWVTRITSKLFFPLHIKIPVQAFALVLVVGLVFLVYRSIEPEIKPSSAPTETAAPALRDEVPREPQKSIPGPEPPPQKAPLKEKADVAGSAKEEAALPSAPPQEKKMEKIIEKKSEILAEKPSQEPSVAFAPAPKESPQLQRAPAAPSPAKQAQQATQAGQTREVGEARQSAQAERATRAKDAESRGAAGGTAKDRMESAAPPAARQYKAAAKVLERLEIVIRASDVGFTAKEVETLLNRLGAREIEREPREPGVVIRGVLENRRLVDLLGKLKSLGEVRTEPTLTDSAHGESRVLIQIEP